MQTYSQKMQFQCPEMRARSRRDRIAEVEC